MGVYDVTWSLSGVDSIRWGLQSVSMWRPPVTVRRTSLEVPGRHGAISAGLPVFEEPTVSLTMWLHGSTQDDIEDATLELVGLLTAPGLTLSRTSGNLVTSAPAALVSVTPDEFTTAAEATFEVVLAIPSALLRAPETDSALAGSGAVLGLTGSTGPVGDAVLRVKDPDDFELTDVVSGTGVSWSGSLPGWYLFIDTATLRAWLSQDASAWAGGSATSLVITNRTTNPRPASAARWRVSGGETVMFIANDRGKPALEFVDPVGDGGLYGDPQDNYQPALGQYAALGYDLCALDAMTADRLRVTWSGYSGDTPSSTTKYEPLARPRINMCIDPRATAAARWSAAGTAYNITETMVTGATDGPVLPDGSRVTSYARYTIGASGDGSNTWFGYSPVAPAGTPYPAGTKAALAIYARPSRTQSGNARLYGRAYGAAGAIIDPQFGDYGSLPAGQWTRLGMVHASTQAVGDWLAYAHLSAPTWQPGDTIEVTAGFIEPFAETITPHFDAAMAATADVEPVWAGAANASISRGLRPYQRVVHSTRLTAFDPAGYLRALIWPNPQVAYPGNGFRVREAVVAFADTEEAARAAVAAFFDGESPDTALVANDWTGPANASPSTRTVQVGKATSLLDFPAAGRLQLWPRMPGADPSQRTARVTFTGAAEVVVRARPAYL